MGFNGVLQGGLLQPIKVISEQEAGKVLMRAQAGIGGRLVTGDLLVLTDRYVVFGPQHFWSRTHFEELTWIPLGWIRPQTVRANGLLVKKLCFQIADGTECVFTVNASAGPSAKEFAGALCAVLLKG